MALERKDNIGDTSTTTGTGTFSLAAVAQSGARIFAGNVTSGATVRYHIESADKSEWEVGEGVFTDGSPDTLTRVTVYASSNAGSLVNFSAGTKNVSLVMTAKDADQGDNIHISTEKTTPVDADELGLVDSAASYLLKRLTILGLKMAVWAGIKPAEGTMWNGKISVTDAAGITVALKTLAGTNPSASDPVYITLGGAVRTITSALSVSKADGTNWFNAGSAELATKEIDYFVYLGYNATDGVVIGFARIPFANQYSDFSATTTNEKYCAISTITNAAATDYYEVIGRFAATLSAGAGYTWTVPTFTASNLIQRPIYESRDLAYNAVASSSAGSLTAYTNANARYKIVGDICYVNPACTITTVGTASGALIVTLPFTFATTEGTGWGYEIRDSAVGTLFRVMTYGTKEVRYTSYNNPDVLSSWGLYVLACRLPVKI